MMLPPGRAKLATKPLATGSAICMKTIGMVVVSRCNGATVSAWENSGGTYQVVAVAFVGGRGVQSGVPAGMYLIHIPGTVAINTNVTFRVGDANATSATLNETPSRELYLVVSAQSNGNACTRTDTCSSGFCVSAICCDAACTGSGYTCTTGTCTAPATATASTGGGSGGSGGTTTTTPTQTVTLAISANTPATAAFTTTSLDVTSITVTTTAGAPAATITATEATSPPAGVPAPSGTVSTYLELSTNVPPSTIATVTISFKVSKAWAIANGIDISTIALARYANGAWTSLPTTQTSSDASYYYFTATSPGFSTFAIVGQKQAVAPGKACVPQSKRCSDSALQQCAADGAAWATAETCSNGCDATALKCKEAPAPPAPEVKPPVPPQPPAVDPLVVAAVVIVIVIIAAALLLRKRR